MWIRTGKKLEMTLGNNHLLYFISLPLLLFKSANYFTKTHNINNIQTFLRGENAIKIYYTITIKRWFAKVTSPIYIIYYIASYNNNTVSFRRDTSSDNKNNYLKLPNTEKTVIVFYD